MAQNTLMFEVGVDLAKSQFEAIKGQIDTYVGQWQKDLNIKVKIENLDALTSQLKNLGDSQGLRTLRTEIEAINKEFAKLAAGAGGTGTMAIRSLNQSIVEQEQEVKKYERILEQLRTAQSKFPEGSSSYKKYSETIATNETSLNAAKKSLQDFKDRLDSINSAPLKGVSESAKVTEQTLAAMKPMMDGISTSVKTLTENMSRFVSEMQKAGTAPAPKVAGQGIFDVQKFNTLQEAIDKVVSEVNRLATALNGMKIDGLTELTRVVNGLQINANSVSSAFQSMEGKLKFQGTAEEFAVYERRIQDLKKEIANLEAQAKNTAESVKKMNTEFKSIGEKPSSETARTDNLDKLRAHAEVVNKALERMQAEYDKLGQNGLFDERLKSQIEALRSYAQHLKNIESNPILSKAGGLKSASVMFNGDTKVMGDVVKSMYSEKTIKAFVKEVNDLLQAKVVQDLKRQPIQLKAPRPDEKDAIGDIIEKNKARLQEWRKHFAEAMQYMRQQMKRTSAGGGDTTMLQNAFKSYYKMAVQLGQSVTQETLKDTQAVDLLTQRYHALRNEVLATANVSKTNSMTREGINEANIREATVAYAKLKDRIDGLVMSRDKLASAGKSTSALDAEIAKGKEFMRILSEISKKGYYGNLRTWDVVKSADFRTIAPNAHDAVREMREYQKAARDAAKQAEKDNAAAAKALAAENAARRQATQYVRNQAEASANARREMLQGQAKELQQLLSLGSGKLGTTQYDAVRDALRAIREELRQIETMTQRGGLSSGLLMSMGSGRNYAGVISSAQAVVGMREKAVSATNHLVEAERHFGEALVQSTNQMRNQSQVLSDLKSMALQYLSVWGAQSFINNIIEQGGQLEQQRLSIQAILGDAAHAQTLFNQVKALAVKSPFGVTQIDQMTKQLSAYGFQYSELFDLTKRMADISAATGTEVSRLALALGHVKSEAALSGYTLRQFSMANIPLLTKLTEKLGVSAKEVRNMVRKKEIGYDIVLEILKELTDESGMFYNAQETMSEALNAKFKNLRDSFQIMYSEMAEGAPGNFLKSVAVSLTEMSKNWKILMPMLMAGAGIFGSLRLSTYLLNQGFMATGRAMSYNAIATSKYSMAQLRLMANTGRLTIAMRGLGAALSRIGKFVLNPINMGITAVFAAVEGLVYLWQKNNQEMEKAKELSASFKQEGEEGVRNLTESIGLIDPSTGKKDTELKQGIESMSRTLRDYGVNVGEVFNEAFGADSTGKVKSLAEQYDFLRYKLEETLNVYNELKETSDAFEFGIKRTNGGWLSWLDDDVNTNLTQYSEALKDFSDKVTEYSINYNDSIEKAIAAAEKADPAFAKATEGMKSYADKLRVFWENPSAYSKGIPFINTMFNGGDSDDAQAIMESFYNIQNTRQTAMKEVDMFMDGVEAKMKEKGYDFNNLTKTQVDNLMKQSREWINSHPEWANIIEDIKSKLETRWPIRIEPEAENTEERLQDWQKQMQDWLDAHGKPLTIKADMTRADIIKMVHEGIKDAQEVIDQTSPILLRFGVDLGNIPSEGDLPSGLQTPWGKKSAADNKQAATTLQQLQDFIKSFYLPSPKDKSKKSGSSEDKNAKELRERVRILKEAESAYQYWRKAVGDDAAVSHVNDEFGKLLSEQKFSFHDVDKFKETLQALRSEYEKKPKTKAMLEALKELDKIFADLGRKDFEEDTSQVLSKINIELDAMKRKWDIFSSMRKATGDIGLSMRFAGIVASDGMVFGDFSELLEEKVNKDLAANGITVKISQLGIDMNTSDKEIKTRIENLFNENKPLRANGEGDEDFAKRLAEYESNISGIVEETKKLRDATQETAQRAAEAYSSAIGKAVDYASQISRINDELAEQNRLIDMNKNLSEGEKNRAKALNQSNADIAIMQAGDDYKRFINGIFSETTQELKRMERVLKNTYLKALNNGAITAEEYAKKIQEIDEIMRKSVAENTNAWYNKGIFQNQSMTDMFQNQYNRGLEQYQQASDMFQQGSDIFSKSGGKAGAEMMTQGSQMMQGAQSMMQGAQGGMQAMLIIDKIVHGIDDSIQGTVKAFDYLKECLESFGNHNDWLYETSDYLSTISEMSSHVTQSWDNFKNGNMVGASVEAFGAVTSVFTGLNRAHDNRRERRIEELRKDVQKIDNTLNLIKSLREKTLGYDKGTMRRQMAILYSNNKTESGRAMYEYYSRGGLDGTGYQQELEAYKKQRADYQEMYNQEIDKKDSSDAALEEYTSKMAELDLTIRNYSMDIANELFGIDFVGWSDQISDALLTAFENGEDAAEAFGDTVRDIMNQSLKKMLSLGIIQPMMERLQKKLFGENGSGGTFNPNNPEGTIDAAMRDVAEFFGEGGEGQKMVAASETFYEKWKNMMASMGMSLDEESESSSTTSSIKGITEQTADLLASYVNAIRADVSVNRAMIAQYFPMFHDMLTRGNSSLGNIENHTAAIMRSNDAIASSVKELQTDVRGLKNKTWKMPIA